MVQTPKPDRKQVLDLLESDTALLTADEIACWLGVSRRTVKDRVSVQPGFPKAVAGFSHRRTLRWPARALRAWAKIP